MSDLFWIAAVLLWVAWCAQAILAAMQVGKFASRLQQPDRASFKIYRPPAAVIVPFKGVEVGLASNIRRLWDQRYPDYRLMLVVDSRDDSAVPLLERQMAEHPQRRAQILVAGPAGPHEGQKVRNLLAAVGRLSDENSGEQVWVFADSDAAVGPSWLADLIGPLGQPKTGVTTGYRWLIPQAVNGRTSLASHLASLFNSSVACFNGRDRFNHAWGGSMALRVQTATDGDLIGRWRGALSDDYQVSTMCRALGLRIYFVPRCLVASPVAFRFADLWNFTCRQYVITRIHAPKLYAAAIGFHSLFLAGCATAWATLLLAPASEPLWTVALLAILTVCGAHQVRSGFRHRAVERAFGPQVKRCLKVTLRLDRWATTLWMCAHWLVILRCAVGRRIRWRGMGYWLLGPQRIQRN